MLNTVFLCLLERGFWKVLDEKCVGQCERHSRKNSTCKSWSEEEKKRKKDSWALCIQKIPWNFSFASGQDQRSGVSWGLPGAESDLESWSFILQRGGDSKCAFKESPPVREVKVTLLVMGRAWPLKIGTSSVALRSFVTITSTVMVKTHSNCSPVGKDPTYSQHGLCLFSPLACYVMLCVFSTMDSTHYEGVCLCVCGCMRTLLLTLYCSEESQLKRVGPHFCVPKLYGNTSYFTQCTNEKQT